MSNDAEHLEALLAEYVDGGLDASSAQLVEDHLSKNPAIRAEVEQMRLDRASLRTLPRVGAPAGLSEDLRGRLERDLLLDGGPINTERSRRFSTPVAAIAAMVVVGLGLAGLAYTLLGNRPKPFPEVAIRDTATPPTDAGPTAPPEVKPTANVSAVENRGDDAKGALAKKERRVEASALPGEQMTAAPMANNAAQGEEASKANVPAAMAEASAATDAARSQPDATAGGAMRSVASVASTAAAPTEPAFAVTDELLPADAAAAIAGQSLDPARRSVVVVVDKAHALDAFAFASRYSKSDENALEVTDAGQRLATMHRARSPKDASRESELAVIARGLPEASASSIQAELRRVDPKQASAFEVTPPPSQPFVDRAPTLPTTLPKTLPTTTPAGQAFAGLTTLTTRQSALPTTEPAALGPSLIRNGERLRVTLTDPDAFDLRTQHEVTVDPAGNVALPSLDAVRAAGKSSESLRLEIVDLYRNANLMRRPVVRVESLDSGASSRDPSQLIDLYVVVRPSPAEPTSQPSSMPTTQATTQPTTQPAP